ncbi:hypothetical protein METP2_03483 [Methanosarcinales archaeon]|nr:hypothetical protein METP2_03483 [Methanosarcinales archaeon]
MIEKPMRIKVKPEYEDIPDFEVLVYSPNDYERKRVQPG